VLEKRFFFPPVKGSKQLIAAAHFFWTTKFVKFHKKLLRTISPKKAFFLFLGAVHFLFLFLSPSPGPWGGTFQ